MKSMKLKPAEQKDLAICCPSTDSKPEYPYGLRIELTNETLEKLGIEALPKVGTALMLNAKVEVVSRGEHESEDGERKNLCLQITDMELAGEGVERPSKAKKFYRTQEGVERDSKKMIPIEGPE